MSISISSVGINTFKSGFYMCPTAKPNSQQNNALCQILGKFARLSTAEGNASGIGMCYRGSPQAEDSLMATLARRWGQAGQAKGMRVPTALAGKWTDCMRNKCGEDVEERGPSCTVRGNVNYDHCGKKCRNSSKN